MARKRAARVDTKILVLNHSPVTLLLMSPSSESAAESKRSREVPSAVAESSDASDSGTRLSPQLAVPLVIALLLLMIWRAAARDPGFSRAANPVSAAAQQIVQSVSPATGTEAFDASAVDHSAADIVTLEHGWADESKCIDCHDQATDFHQTGHARTLHRASDPFSKSRLLELNQFAPAAEEGISIHSHDELLVAVSDRKEFTRQLQLGWCFGSGTHACTWAATLPDSLGNSDLLEFRYSWFAQKDGFGITPGQPDHPGQSAVVSFGLLFDGPKAQRCFSCHATVVPNHDGRIHEDGIQPGVMCQRCHGPRQQHVATEGAHHPDGWKIADRMDSVLRCAVCHRLAEEKDPAEIYAGNPDIVRFQPIGLMRSPCFLKSDMSCTTCHDPHQTMEQQDSRGIWQCVQCHDPEQVEHATCAAGHRDRCFECHMPQVQMEFPVAFTDHWIRVIDPQEGAAGDGAAATTGQVP